MQFDKSAFWSGCIQLGGPLLLLMVGCTILFNLINYTNKQQEEDYQRRLVNCERYFGKGAYPTTAGSSLCNVPGKPPMAAPKLDR